MTLPGTHSQKKHSLRKTLFLLLILVMPACQHREVATTGYSDTLFFGQEEDSTDLVPAARKETEEDNTIRYGIYSPAEVAGMFRRRGLKYDPDILSPTDAVSHFNTRSQIALNLGVYGADLSYIQMFGSPDASRYLDVILRLAGQLGIPQDFIRELVERIDNNIANNDSLIQISLEAYNTINHFLLEENQEDIAYLILAGAWIEAMYIAVHDLLKDNDPEIVKKVVEQKYSLNYLLSSMKNYYNDTSVAYVYRRLFVLKKYLDHTRLEFDDQQIRIDKERKEIIARPHSIQYSSDTLEKIREIVVELRNQILNK